MNKKPWRVGWTAVGSMTAEIAANTIFNTARSGTPVNPGLPVGLANLLVAQAAHETGNFTSRFFRDYNNAFGYSWAGSRYQTGPGPAADNGQPIGVYASVADSTREIVDWIYRRQKEGKFPADLSTITTPDQYAQLLKNAGYYGDTLSNYTAGLRRFFTNIVAEISTPSGLGLVAIASILIWIATRKR